MWMFRYPWNQWECYTCCMMSSVEICRLNLFSHKSSHQGNHNDWGGGAKRFCGWDSGPENINSFLDDSSVKWETNLLLPWQGWVAQWLARSLCYSERLWVWSPPCQQIVKIILPGRKQREEREWQWGLHPGLFYSQNALLAAEMCLPHRISPGTCTTTYLVLVLQ